MKSLFFDLVCGASGDMILASLLDLGASLEALRRELGRTGIPGLELGVEKQSRNGVLCSKLKLAWPQEASKGGYRHLEQILGLIAEGRYCERVACRCRAVLQRLAEAEAEVHGIAVEEVHFHEIGAVDTIVDILGSCLCLEHLEVERLCFSTLTVGTGTVRTAHGLLPLPAPATARLIRGYRVRQLDTGSEILTPTGAALLTGLGSQEEAGLHGRVEGIGYACGDKLIPGFSDFLRVFLIQEQPEP